MTNKQMKVVIQRVSSSSVTIDAKIVAEQKD
jgi:D-Tyr-tRNAtyr deacylase